MEGIARLFIIASGWAGLMLVWSVVHGAKIVATTTFIADIAKNIAGDKHTVISLIPIGTDPHIYEPTPSDATTVASADLLLRNGLTLEGWLDKLVKSAGKPSLIIRTVTDNVVPIEADDHPGAVDPHAWMSPLNGLIYAENIFFALQTLDPNNQNTFRQNLEAYKAKLLALHQAIKTAIDSIPVNQRVLITSHDAFRYFAKTYGLEVESVMGTSTDADVQAEVFKRLSTVIDRTGVKAIFVESTINPKLIQQLAEDKGIVVGGALFADSIGDENSGANSYLDMLRLNAMLITNGLQGRVKPLTFTRYVPIFVPVLLLLFGLVFWALSRHLKPKSMPTVNWSDFTLTVEGITVYYDQKAALHNIFLKLESGKVYGLIGANGSGKSTLVKTILGLLKPVSGKVRLHHLPIEQFRQAVAYLPQKEEIDWQFPATVEDIVLMGRYPHLRPFQQISEQDRAIALAALDKLGLTSLKNKPIGALSGGQQQRTFIARALAQQAQVYILDEPFVGVDVTTETQIIQILRALAQEGKLVLIIHHDLSKVKAYFDAVIMLNQHVVAFGAVDDVFTPENITRTYGGRPTLLF